MTPAARIAAAIDLLADIDAKPRRPADAVANDFFRARRFIGSGDRRAVSDRVWSVLRASRRLAWHLGRQGAHPTPRLLVAASLLAEGWRFDGVEQSYSGGQFAPMTLSGDERRALKPMQGATLAHPDMPDAVRWEVQDWIAPRLAAVFGDAAEREMAAMLEPATLDLRVNTLRGTREAALTALAGEGIEAQPTPLSPWGLRIDGRRAITSGPAFQSGLVEIQDEGSQLVAALADARPGMRVLDYCAGAAGKTLALAMCMNNQGQIVACDVSAPRLEGAVRRLRRAGVHNAERHLLVEGDKWAKRREATFDRVLVDAPCTGTGTWRRNPDARARLRITDLNELLSKQTEILNHASRLVRVGGRLIYATCSLLAEENEMQVRAFLATRREFTLMPLGEAWGSDVGPPCQGDFLSLSPARNQTDGFFAAVMSRGVL